MEVLSDFFRALPLSELKQAFLEIPDIARMHLAADAAIVLAYLIALVTLIVFLVQRRDLSERKLYYFIGLFLLGGATIHVTNMGAAWFPLYPFQGYAKYFVAFSLLFSVLFLWRILPKAKKLPHPKDVKASEEQFQDKLKQIQKSEAALLVSRDLLESKLQSKVKDLESHEKKLAGALADYQKEKKVREQTYDQLKSKEAYFEGLSRSSRELILVLDREFRLKDPSQSVLALLGYEKEKLVGNSIFDYIHSEDASKVREGLRQKKEDQDVLVVFKMRHSKGNWRLFEATVHNDLEEKGVQGIVIAAQDVTYRNEIEEELTTLPKIVDEIGSHQDFHSALEIALKRICEFTGWDYGEAWISRGEGKVLECSPSWYGDGSFDEFRKISEELRFPPNMGIPGAVWSLRRPKWLTDVETETHSFFTRQAMCRKAGVRAALGIPILDGDKVLAVLVFMMRKPKREDRRLVYLITAMALELASLFQRKRAEEGLREAHDLLDKRIHEKTKHLEKANENLKQEIAARRGSEENLRMSQENHLKLVNSLDGIVWEYDLKTERYTFVSDQAERMLGYPVEAWIQENSFWQEHIHGQDREPAASFRKRVAHDCEDDQFEYRMITADGRNLWLRDMVTVVMESGKPAKLCGVMVDITERRQVEEALNQERNFVSAVLETAGALVMILDVEGRIESFNRACELTSGFPISEVKGKTFWEVFTVPEETEKIKSIYTRLLAGQFPTNFEGSWIAKDGSRRVIAWTTTALFRKDGSVEHVITTGIDITKRKDAEQKLQEAVTSLAFSNEELDKSSHDLKEANDRLKKMDELKSHFISAASHELRTPLTSVKGYVDVILEGDTGPINEQQQEFLSYVKESTERLHRLLNELLDISKIESGQVEMRMERTNVRSLLKEEMMIFKAHADEKKISIVLETDPSLKDICCDMDKIKEVIGNLLSNAIKYTPAQGRIRILARNYGEESIRVDVEDSGIGIRKVDQSRIFEPFQHIEKEGMDHEESTGLGLTLVKKIVEAHGGSVHAESEEGVGSKFSVFLPLGEAAGEIKQSHWVVSHE